MFLAKNDFKNGFKLTYNYLSDSRSDKSIRKLHGLFPGKEILVITQTSINNRDGEAKIRILDDELRHQLNLDRVVSLLRDQKYDDVPQVDGLWWDKNLYPNIVVITFSNVAPVVTATSGTECFLSTLLKDYISPETFSKILGDRKFVDFRIPLSTNYEYDNGTLPKQIENLISMFGRENHIHDFDPKINDPNLNPNLFGYGESDPITGLCNNIVAI